MTERWLPIADYPDYEVSDGGRVRRVTSRTCAKAGSILKMPMRTGYPCVDLCREGRKKTVHVHRLVAAAFLEPKPGFPEVNHIDGVKTNACATNLEWSSRQTNQLHAYRSGLQDASGEKNGQSKLTREQVVEIRHIAARGDRPSYPVIGRQFGVSAGTIRHIVNGDTWA